MEVRLTKTIKRTFLGKKLIYPKGTIAYVDDNTNSNYWLLDFYDGYVFGVKISNFIQLKV